MLEGHSGDDYPMRGQVMIFLKAIAARISLMAVRARYPAL